MSKPAPKFLKVTDCARELGVDRHTIYDWITARKLTAIKIEETIRIPADTWAKFLQVHTRKGAV